MEFNCMSPTSGCCHVYRGSIYTATLEIPDAPVIGFSVLRREGPLPYYDEDIEKFGANQNIKFDQHLVH